MERLFKALGDLNRLRILNVLLNHTACVCEIEQALGLLQTNVSRNLSKLSSIGIVTTQKKAQWVYYQVSAEFYKSNELLMSYLEEAFKKENIFQEDLSSFNENKERCNGNCC